MYEVTVVVGINVRRLRRMRQYTQEQLALEAGISSDYLSRLELGKENPTIDVLARLAAALGAGITDLFDQVHDTPFSAGIVDNTQSANST